MKSVRKLISTLEIYLGKGDRNAPEDNENYENYKKQAKLLREALVSDCKWKIIKEEIIQSIAELLNKMIRIQLICDALCEYLISFKFYGKFLRKKAFVILMNMLRRIRSRFTTDVDLVVYAQLPEMNLDPICLGGDFTSYYHQLSIPFSSTNTCNHLRYMYLVNEFEELVFVRKDFKKNFDLNDYQIFRDIGEKFNFLAEPRIKFLKKMFRYLIDKNSFNSDNGSRLVDLLKELKKYCMEEGHDLLRTIFCNRFHFAAISAELIYHYYTNTNNEYLDMTKTFFLRRDWESKVNEHDLIKIDYDYILFDQIEDRNYYGIITLQLIEFVNGYFEELLDSSFEELYDEKYLKIHRMSYLIFHKMLEYVKEKNVSVLKDLYEIRIKRRTDDKLINIKISKAFDKYVALMRFLFYIEAVDEDYYLKTHNTEGMEDLRYANFNSVLDISSVTAELHLVCAATVCHLLRKFIQKMEFLSYKALVLERFMLFLIMLKKTYNVSRIFLSYYEFVLEEAQKDPRFSSQNYFWLSLFRIGMICEKEDLDPTVSSIDYQRFQNLIDTAGKMAEIQTNSDLQINLEMILSKTKYRCYYEKYVYLTSIRVYLKNNSLLYSELLKSEKFLKILTKLLSKLV